MTAGDEVMKYGWFRWMVALGLGLLPFGVGVGSKYGFGLVDVDRHPNLGGCVTTFRWIQIISNPSVKASRSHLKSKSPQNYSRDPTGAF